MQPNTTEYNYIDVYKPVQIHTCAYKSLQMPKKSDEDQ